MDRTCPGGAHDSFELTSSQYAMWLGQQMQPDVPISVAQYIDLHSATADQIDVEVLDLACQQAAREYFSAQTRFLDTPDGPLQFVDADANVGLEVIDLTAHADPVADAIAWMRGEYSSPLDLGVDVLSLNRLLILSADRAFWYVRMHHALLDGYAAAAMVRRVEEIYTAVAEGQEPPAISPQHPREMVAAEEKYFDSPRHAKDLEHWTLLAADLPDPVTLNRRTAAPSALNHRVNGTTGDVPAEVMHEATQRLGSNVSGVILAAFAGYLAQMADVDDVVLHLPVAARTTAAARRSAGMLANAVPVAGRCGYGTTVGHLVEQTGRDIRTALRHQLLPASEITAPRLSGSHAGGAFGPTVNIMMFSTSVQLGEIGGTLNLLTSGPCDDVALTVYETPSGTVRIDLESNPRSYTEAQTRAHHQRFLAYLREFITASPTTALSEISAYTDNDRKLLAHNAGSPAGPLRTIREVLESSAADHPHRVAIDDGARTLTYAELEQWAFAAAQHTLAASTSPQSAELIVPVLIPRSAELSCALWTTAKMGAGYVPLDPALPDQRLRTILTDTDATVGLTTVDNHTRASELAPSLTWVCIDQIQPANATGSATFEPVTLDHPAYLVYTSGSTGVPKGVVVTHRGIGPITDELIARHRITPSSRVMQFVSPGFDASVLEMLMAFGAGATLVVISPGIYGGPELAQALGEGQVTSGFITPAALETISPDDVAGLARLGVGGDAIADSLVAAWSQGTRQLVNVYGPTETTIAVTLNPLNPNSPVALGFPIAGTTLYVLDRHLRQAPAGVPGELYIHGPGIARCYRGRSDLTAQRFVANPFSSGERLYRTGDLVRWDHDGLTFLGRTDNQVKIRGFRMELGDIETALRAADGVDQAVVVALGDGLDRRLVGYVTVHDADAADTFHSEAARADMADRLPHYMIPSQVVLCPALPLTANGKVDKARLPQPPELTAVAADSASEQPTTDLQRLIVRAFAEQLGVTTVGLRDNFFDLGGNSLTATRLSGALSEALGASVGVREIFGFPRAGDLAERLGALGYDTHGSAVAQAQPPRSAVRTPGTPIPLSPSQTQMWLHNQVEDDASYNIPLVLTLAGHLDIEALRAAIIDVAQRHEPLRTRFPRRDDGPHQMVVNADAIAVSVIASEPDVDEQVRELASRPFDLTESLPLRASIIQVDPDRHLLVIVVHHISADGASLEPLMADLATAYTARQSGHVPQWTPLAHTYIDYTLDKAQALTRQRSELSDFWVGQLLDAPHESTVVPTNSRPAAPSGSAHIHSTEVSSATGDAIRALADATGSSPFIVMHAAVAATLARLSAQADVVIGAVTAGRNDPRLDCLVGCFVNSVPLRLTVTQSASFAELVRTARDIDFAAFDHADLPFTELLSAVSPHRVAGRHPLFQVMINYLNPVGGDLQLGDLTIDASTVDVQPARFDLEFTITPHLDGHFGVELRYATELFDESLITSVLSAWEQILTVGSAEPTTPLSRIALVADHSAAELVPAHGRPSHRDHTLRELILDAVDAHPHHVAVESSGQTMTYAQLLAAASQLAHHLVARGVGPEDRVALLFPRSLHSTLALWSVALTGAIAAPIDARFPPIRRDFITDDCQATIGLTDVAHRPPHGGIDWIALDDADLLGAVAQMPSIPPTLGQLTAPTRTDQGAYLIYTSGSTGQPKGTLVTHAGLGNFAAEQRERYDVTPLSRVLGFASPSFDAAMLEALMALGGPATLVIADPDIYGGDEAAQFITDQRITHCFLTPSVLASMPQHGCASLRRISVGGEHWTRSVAERWSRPGRHLHNGYGPSETTIMVAISDPVAPRSDEPLTIGRPVRGMRALVLDDHLAPVPPGVPGELYVAGPQLARGYHRRPGLTAARFVADPTVPGKRMYRTGDIVRWRWVRGSYELEYLRRNDGQIKLRGQRLELAEIDRAAEEFEGVTASVTVVVDGERLATYITGTATGPEVKAHLSAKLPSYMVPATVTALDELPLTPVGKVDVHALPTPVHGTTGTHVPRTATHQWLIECFGKVLGHNSIGIDDDFFDLGGNSLSATTLAGYLNEYGDTRVPVRAVFDHRTVAALATYLDETGTSTDGPRRRILPLAPRPERIPLSASQERMWLLNEIDPAAATYTIMIAFRLRGNLDSAAIRTALHTVITRHEVLRTVYPTDAQGPHQVIVNPPSDVLPSAPEGGRWQQHLIELATQSFDLTRQTPLRSLLIPLDEDDHIVALAIHHIAADGGSMAPLTRELMTAYHLATQGNAPELPEMSVQYADVALWQRNWATGRDFADGMAYWRERLATLPAEITFPTDHPRTSVDTRAGEVSAYIDPSVVRGISDLARRHGASEFMVVHAALATLLARMAGTSDVAIGTPVAGRGEAELTDLIGMFVNTLVLRTSVRADQTFSDLLTGVRDDDLTAFDHADTPFEQLVEQLSPPRTPTRHPLFQVMLAFQNSPAEPIALPDVTIESIDIPATSTTFDVTVELMPTRTDDTDSYGYDLRVRYARALYRESTARSLARRFVALLTDLTEGPNIAVGDHDIPSPSEHAELVQLSSSATRPILLGEFLLQVAATHGDSLAIDDAETHMTYRDVLHQASALSDVLHRNGVRADDVVAVAMDRSWHSVVALWACALVGATYTPIDPHYPSGRIAFQLDDAEPVAGLTLSEYSGDLPDTVQWIAVDTLTLRALTPVRSVPTSSTAYMIYTSGSTGQPKGVRVGHRGIAAFAAALTRTMDTSAQSRVTHLTSLAFDASVLELLLAFASGARIVVAPPRMYGADLAQFLVQRKVTHMFITPAALATVPAGTYPDLRAVGVGGDAVGADVVARWSHPQRLINMYGPTESTVAATMGQLSADQPVTIGTAIEGSSTVVLDARLRPVAPGCIGELYLVGDGLALGYHGQSGLTAGRFVANPFAADGARMYRTGDAVRWVGESQLQLEFIGRTDDQVKVRGFRIEVGEVSSVLANHPAVDSAVVRVVGSGADAQLVAYFTGRALTDPAAELGAHCATSLPPHMVPSAFVALDSVPLTPNGKVDTTALPTPPRASTTVDEPESELEAQVCAVFTEVLATAPVGRTSNFFELGGTSLLTAQLVDRLRIQIPAATTISISTVFSDPTPAGIAAAIAPADPITPSRRDTENGSPLTRHLIPIREVPDATTTVFAIHPAVGLSWSYAGLLSHLHADASLIGVQARGIDQRRPRPRSVEEVARDYVNSVLDYQPTGTVVLLGWSLGGLIAQAMASELKGVGVEVLLVLMDAYPLAAVPADDNEMSLAQMLREFADVDVADENLDFETAAALLRKSPNALASELTADQLRRLYQTYQHFVEIGFRHLPTTYSGDGIFVRAAVDPHPDLNPQLWQPYITGAMPVHTVDCSHNQMAEPDNLAHIAALINAATERQLQDDIR